MQSESLNDLIQIAAFTAKLHDDPELVRAFRGFLRERSLRAQNETKLATNRLDELDAIVRERLEADRSVGGYLQSIWERMKQAVGQAVALPQLGQPLATYAGESLGGTPVSFTYRDEAAVSELRVEPVKTRTVRGVLVRNPRDNASWSLDVFYLGETTDASAMEYLASRPFGSQHQTATIQLVKDGVYAFVLRCDAEPEREVKCNLVWVRDGQIEANRSSGE